MRVTGKGTRHIQFASLGKDQGVIASSNDSDGLMRSCIEIKLVPGGQGHIFRVADT